MTTIKATARTAVAKLCAAWRWSGEKKTPVRVSIFVYSLAIFAFVTLWQNQDEANHSDRIAACESRVSTRHDLRGVLTANRDVLMGITLLFGERGDPQLDPVFVLIDTYDDLLANTYPPITVQQCMAVTV